MSRDRHYKVSTNQTDDEVLNEALKGEAITLLINCLYSVRT